LPLPLAAAEVTVRQLSAALFGAGPGVAVDFAGKSLEGLDLAGLDFKQANLAEADLYGTDLSDARLSGVNLEGARLDRATITRADFSGANLQRATVLRPSIYSELAPHPREAPTFAGARMAGVRVFGRLDFADFRNADMSGARFVGTDGRDENLSLGRGSFRAANFSGANLAGAKFGGSNFSYARFAGANLAGADLRGCDLTRADFSDADLTGADLSGAIVEEASFSNAKGLEQATGLVIPTGRPVTP